MALKDLLNDAEMAADSFGQRLNAEIKRTNEIAKDVKKTFQDMEHLVTDEQFKLINGQLDKTVTLSEEIADIESMRGTEAYANAKSQFSIDTKIHEIAKKRLALRKSGLDVNSEAYKMAEQNLDNEENMLKSTKEKWKFDSMVEEKQKDMEKNLIGMGGQMQGLVAMSKAFLLTILMNPIAVILTVVVGLLALAWNRYKEIDKLTRNIYQTSGLSMAQTKEMVGHARAISSEQDLLNRGLGESTAAGMALLSTWGSTHAVTQEMVSTTGYVAHMFGQTNEEAAKTLTTLMQIGGLTTEQASQTAAWVYQLSAVAGTDAGQVMKDISAAGDEALKYFGGMPDEMAHAAIEARRMGIELSTLTQSADKLLSLESSIQAEYKAEMMLGRNLNVERVRALMYQGKMADAAKEILKDAGSLAEFQKLGPIKGKAMAEAYGMSYGEMQSMLATEEARKDLTDTQLKEYDRLIGLKNKEKDLSLEGLQAEEKRQTELAAMEAKMTDMKNTIADKIVPVVERIMTSIAALDFDKIIKNLESVVDFVKDWWKWLVAGYAVIKLIKLASGAKGLMGGAAGLFGGGAKGKGGGGFADWSKGAGGGGKGGGKGMSSFSKTVKGLKPSSILKGAAAMVILAAATWVMAKAMQEFSTGVTWSGVAMGIVSLLALVAAALVLGALMMSGVGAVALIAGAAAIVILAGAMWIMGKAMREFSEASEKFIPFLNAMFDGFKLMIDTVADAIVDLLDAIAGNFERLADIGGGRLVSTAGGITAIAGALAAWGVGGALAGIGAAIGEFFGGDPVAKFERFGKLGPNLKKTGEGMDKIVGGMGGLKSAMKGANIDAYFTGWSNIVTRFDAMTKSVGGLVTALQNTREELEKLEPGLMDMASDFLGFGGGDGAQVATGGGGNNAAVVSEIKSLKSAIMRMTIEMDGEKVAKIVDKHNRRSGRG